ncbi:hypothetical protein [Vibrio crassostreae]|uniref:hypothetical protein n=1 Tax=Vibrio crassostreae TaxID=246167 RepID=UPI001B30027C|nr:hypothetical protein [Vibrio crassostreae]
MNNGILKVLVNCAPSDAISTHFHDFEVITDVELFPILNGSTPFMEKKFNHESYAELAETIEKYALGDKKKVLIHSFNPLVHSFLEVGNNKEPSEYITDVEGCAERFTIYVGDNQFASLLDIPSVRNKLDILSIGEAICDTYLCEAINDELTQSK